MFLRSQAFFNAFARFSLTGAYSTLYEGARHLLQESVERPLTWNVGDVARKLRKRRRMSADEFARRAGLNKSTIGSLERATRTPDNATVEAVAKAFGLTFQALYAMVPITVNGETRELVEAMTRLGELNPAALAAFRLTMLRSIEEALKSTAAESPSSPSRSAVRPRAGTAAR